MGDTLQLASNIPPPIPGMDYDAASGTYVPKGGGARAQQPAQQPAPQPAQQPPAAQPDTAHPPVPGMVWSPQAGGYVIPGQVPPATSTTPERGIPTPGGAPGVKQLPLPSKGFWGDLGDYITSTFLPPNYTQEQIDEIKRTGQLPPTATDLAAHQATLGLDDYAAAVIHGTAEALRGNSFTQGFRDSFAQRDTARRQYREENPVASTTAEVTGGVAGSKPLEPLFTARPGFLPAVRNVTAGGVTAGGQALLAGPGDPLTPEGRSQRLQEAEDAGLFGAGLGAVSEFMRLPNVPSAIQSSFTPGTRSEEIAGDLLRQGGAPEPYMVPGRGGANIPPGGAPIGPVPGASPTSAAADASTEATRAIRGVTPTEATNLGTTERIGAQDIIREEGRRFWNTPDLSNPAGVTTASTRQAVNDHIANMRPSDISLYNQDRAADLRDIVEDLNHTAGTMSAQDLHEYYSRFRQVARETDDVRVKTLANDLANQVDAGMRAAPEFAANPQMAADRDAAIAYTKSVHDLLDQNSFDAILRKNARGEYVAPEGTGMAKFYDFTNATPRGGNVKNLDDFLDTIRQRWDALGYSRTTGAGRTFDPAAVGTVQRDMMDNTKNFIWSKMLGAITDGSPERLIDMNKAWNWVDNNRGWLRQSGIFSNDEMLAMERLGDISRSLQGNRLYGAMADPRDARWMDAFIGSPLAGFAKLGAGASAKTARMFFGSMFGGNAEEMVALAAMLPETSAHSAQVVDNFLANRFAAPRAEVLQHITNALQDPQIMADLMRRGRDWQLWSDGTKIWVRRFFSMVAAESGDTGVDWSRRQYERGSARVQQLFQ